jgi:UDP-3-O-[3-hydroxymyristoyl] glucosamine N-acyltransferase
MYTLQQLAEVLEGQVVGDGSIAITGVRPFEEARAGDITLAADPKYRNHLEEIPASAVIVALGIEASGKPLLQVANPKLAFARAIALFHSEPYQASGVSPLAFIGKACRIAANTSIYPFVYIGDRAEIGERVTLYPGVVIGSGCRIGAGCTLYPNVTLYPSVTLGQNVILHSGCVIGADGFGYVFDGEQQVKILQTGTVEIEDAVEIGANSTIDRATFGATVIKRGVKIDDQVHVGHNCRIGENTVISGGVGISGSVTLGKNCILAGQVGVADHVTIGDNVVALARSGVSKDIPSGCVVSGAPAQDHRAELRFEALLRRLPSLYEEWQALRSRLAEDPSGH